MEVRRDLEYWTGRRWRHCGNIDEALRIVEDMESNDKRIEQNVEGEDDGVDFVFDEVVPGSKAESCEELEKQKVEAKMEAKRGVKQSTCGGEAGWYREEESGVRRACMSKGAFKAARRK